MVVELKKNICFDELCLHRRRTNRQNRFARENRRSLGNGIDIAGKAQIGKISEEILVKNAFGTEKIDVLFGKMQIVNVVDYLIKPGADCKAAVIRHTAEEYVEIGDAVGKAVFEIAAAHGKLVKIA